jgi:diadenosine tetraphosphatase ApaH/serine/threonine PP2A family protein phosphatase
MRSLILADIHANITALEAVLKDAESRGGFDEAWGLGDITDYGPDPHECIEAVKKLQGVCVIGNHDYSAIGKMGTSEFNPYAAEANHWTARQLTVDDVNYLDGLPLKVVRGDFTLAHGSPRDPIWEYILDPEQAEENLEHFQTPYCLIGHSHVPLLFECNSHCGMYKLSPSEFKGKSSRDGSWEYTVKLGENRMIINPGGVGQPRDGDPRAAYAVYDSPTGTVTLHRVKYDIRSVQERMRRAGLPDFLVERLAYGD